MFGRGAITAWKGWQVEGAILTATVSGVAALYSHLWFLFLRRTGGRFLLFIIGLVLVILLANVVMAIVAGLLFFFPSFFFIIILTFCMRYAGAILYSIFALVLVVFLFFLLVFLAYCF